ncbi:MAG: hypothetical protein ACI31G_02020 [Bacilli bacterium]
MNIPIKKLLYIVSVPILALSLSSCDVPQFDDEFYDFIEAFSVSKAMKNCPKGQLEYSLTYYRDESSIGNEYSRFEYDISNSNNYYSNRINIYSGELIKDGILKVQRTIEKVDDTNYKDSLIQEIEVDGQIDISIKEELIIGVEAFSLIATFFSQTSEDDSSYSEGGLYYGDQIKLMAQYQKYMVLNQEEEILTIKYPKMNLGEGEFLEYGYSVNKYGMVISWWQEMEKDNLSSNASMTINYGEKN